MADFIEHDEEEYEDDNDFNPQEDKIRRELHEVEESETREEESETKEEDDDADVCAQYNPMMEQQGLITTETGLRRSARANKGRAPVRYVDEDYIGLMISDVDSDVQWSSDEDE